MDNALEVQRKTREVADRFQARDNTTSAVYASMMRGAGAVNMDMESANYNILGELTRAYNRRAHTDAPVDSDYGNITIPQQNIVRASVEEKGAEHTVSMLNRAEILDEDIYMKSAIADGVSIDDAYKEYAEKKQGKLTKEKDYFISKYANMTADEARSGLVDSLKYDLAQARSLAPFSTELYDTMLEQNTEFGNVQKLLVDQVVKEYRKAGIDVVTQDGKLMVRHVNPDGSTSLEDTELGTMQSLWSSIKANAMSIAGGLALGVGVAGSIATGGAGAAVGGALVGWGLGALGGVGGKAADLAYFEKRFGKIADAVKKKTLAGEFADEVLMLGAGKAISGAIRGTGAGNWVKNTALLPIKGVTKGVGLVTDYFSKDAPAIKYLAEKVGVEESSLKKQLNNNVLGVVDSISKRLPETRREIFLEGVQSAGDITKMDKSDRYRLIAGVYADAIGESNVLPSNSIIKDVLTDYVASNAESIVKGGSKVARQVIDGVNNINTVAGEVFAKSNKDFAVATKQGKFFPSVNDIEKEFRAVMDSKTLEASSIQRKMTKTEKNQLAKATEPTRKETVRSTTTVQDRWVNGNYKYTETQSNVRRIVEDAPTTKAPIIETMLQDIMNNVVYTKIDKSAPMTPNSVHSFMKDVKNQIFGMQPSEKFGHNPVAFRKAQTTAYNTFNEIMLNHVQDIMGKRARKNLEEAMAKYANKFDAESTEVFKALEKVAKHGDIIETSMLVDYLGKTLTSVDSSLPYTIKKIARIGGENSKKLATNITVMKQEQLIQSGVDEFKKSGDVGVLRDAIRGVKQYQTNLGQMLPAKPIEAIEDVIDLGEATQLFSSKTTKPLETFAEDGLFGKLADLAISLGLTLKTPFAWYHTQRAVDDIVKTAGDVRKRRFVKDLETFGMIPKVGRLEKIMEGFPEGEQKELLKNYIGMTKATIGTKMKELYKNTGKLDVSEISGDGRVGIIRRGYDMVKGVASEAYQGVASTVPKGIDAISPYFDEQFITNLLNVQRRASPGTSLVMNEEMQSSDGIVDRFREYQHIFSTMQPYTPEDMERDLNALSVLEMTTKNEDAIMRKINDFSYKYKDVIEWHCKTMGTNLLSINNRYIIDIRKE